MTDNEWRIKDEAETRLLVFLLVMLGLMVLPLVLLAIIG